MATYYWVGGAGTWDATTTTNWALSSGGAGNAGVPTSADNAIFDTLSNATAYAVTVGTNAVAADITIAGPASGNVTITSGATAIINCYGSWLNAATGVVFTTTSGAAFNFLATTTGKTITTNSVASGALSWVLAGVGGGWTLGSAFISTSSGFNASRGTFDTGNFAISVSLFNSNSGFTRSVSLGSSTLTLSSGTPISLVATGLTWNAGTSTIICTNAAPVFTASGQTFYNLSFTSTAGSGVVLTNVPVANNIVFTPRTTGGIRLVSISVDLSCNNIDWGAPANATIRIGFISNTRGAVRTLTIASPTAPVNVDFRDINYASGTMTGTSLGNAGNNSNITFTAAKTVYWNLAAGGNWVSSIAWATTSGGTPALFNCPLAQDTAIIENTGLTAGNTITFSSNNYYMPALDMSTRTANMTFANGTSTPLFCGNLIFQSTGTLTLTGTGTIFFNGSSSSSTQTVTSNGVSFPQPITIGATPGNSVVLGSALTTAGTLTLSAGTLDLNNYSATALTCANSGAVVRSIAFGTGQMYLTGSATTIWNAATVTNFSYTGTGIVNLTYAGGLGTRTLTHGSTGVTEANTPNFNITAGTDTVATSSACSVKNLNFTGFAGVFGPLGAATGYGNLTFSTGMTTSGSTNTLTMTATSGTQTITSNGVTINFQLTLSGITFLLADALTLSAGRVLTLTSGTLDMNSYALTCGIFSASNTNVRSVLFGTAQMYLTGNANTIWAVLTATNFSYTGTGIVNCTYAGSTGQRVIGHGSTGGTEANTPSVNVTAGTDNFAFNSNTRAKNLNFTGWGAGGVGLLTFNTFNIYGDLTLSPGSVTNSLINSVSFIGTSGTKTITSNGVVFNQNMIFNGAGSTWQLADALSLPDVRTITLASGTFNANNQNVTAGFFNGGTTSVRSLNMGNGTWTMTGVFATASANTFDLTNTTNLTFNSGQSTLTFTGATSKYFYGGGKTFWKVVQGGAGNLFMYSTSSSATVGNTMRELSNSVSPAIIISYAPQVHTVSFFTVAGTAGNLVVINSLAMSKSFDYVNSDYLNIVNSAVSGGAAWYAGANSVDSGGNSGWIFTAAPPFTINAGIAETATSTDTPTVAPSEFNAGVANTVTGTDTIRQTSTYNIGVADSVTATVTDSSSLLWVTVDDSQTPNWVQINT